MVWSLFMILALPTHFDVAHISDFQTMDECFQAREQIILTQGSPYENNYQLVCVTKKIKGEDA